MKSEQSIQGSTEERILACAEQMFMERGFAGTNMSDIAAAIGINRPTLHYYFRTKGKLFQTVLGRVLLSFVPRVYDIISRADLPIGERTAQVVDAYFALFTERPCLPLFMAREIQRDPLFLLQMARREQIDHYTHKIFRSLQAEMDGGRLKRVPILYVFYTFYGLLSFPFLTRKLAEVVLQEQEGGFEALLGGWKEHVVAQVSALLSVDK